MGTSLCDVSDVKTPRKNCKHLFSLTGDIFQHENVCLTLLPKMHTELHSGLHYYCFVCPIVFFLLFEPRHCGILTSADSDQPVHPLLSIETPNGVRSVA